MHGKSTRQQKQTSLDASESMFVALQAWKRLGNDIKTRNNSPVVLRKKKTTSWKIQPRGILADPVMELNKTGPPSGSTVWMDPHSTTVVRVAIWNGVP